MSDQREALETWAKSPTTGVRVSYDNGKTWVYDNRTTEVAWQAWQAAIEHAKKTMCNRS